MNFISLEFLILLTVIVPVCRLMRGPSAIGAIVIASFLFYGWWEPAHLFILVAVIGISHLGGLWLAKRPRAGVLWTSIVMVLLPLLYFKYTNFVIDNVNLVGALVASTPALPYRDIVLPIGVSFFTFQAIAYLVDVYRGEVPPERSIWRTAAFLCFFPQLVAGPIERAGHLLPQLSNLEAGRYDDSLFPIGVFQILLGFVVKFVIADNLGAFVDDVYGHLAQRTPADAVSALYFFSFQIYADFWGYTLIALGTAHLLGIRLTNNFDQPYLSWSIREFWRRWHISLSNWFRDYVYVPLGGSRVSPAKHGINLVVTMLLVGLWHGASYMFVLWGCMHGLALGLHAVLRRLVPNPPLPTALWRLLGVLVTFHVVTMLWIPFRADGAASALQMLSLVVDAFTGAHAWKITNSVSFEFYVYLAVAVPLIDIGYRYLRLVPRLAAAPTPVQAIAISGIFLITYLAPIRDVQFIYFQF